MIPQRGFTVVHAVTYDDMGRRTSEARPRRPSASPSVAATDGVSPSPGKGHEKAPALKKKRLPGATVQELLDPSGSNSRRKMPAAAPKPAERHPGEKGLAPIEGCGEVSARGILVMAY